MGLIEDLTPAHYELMRIGLQRNGADVVAVADLRILNASGKFLATHNPSTTLTLAEKQALLGFVGREMSLFETATGLTEWTGT
jgi:hypothetical protein